MPGFTPRKHQGKPVQQFADGGFVQRVKRAVGLDTEFNERVAAYRAQAAAEKAAKAPAPAPAAPGAAPQEQKAVTDYSGMGATQRREKALGLADGGLIQGPGTGTSDDIDDEMRPGTFILPADTTQAMGMGAEAEPDSDDMEPDDDDSGKVPVRVSNGEFEITPEQVQAIGAAVLRTVKDMTHEPAGQPSARGFAPAAQAFADGGQVKDEERQRLAKPISPTNIWPQGSPSAGRSPYVSTPPTAAVPAPAPSSPSSADVPKSMNDGRIPSAVGMPLPQEQGSPFMTAPSARAGLTQGQTPARAAPAAPAASPAQANPTATANVTHGAAFGVFNRPETAGNRGGMMQPYAATGPKTFEPAKSVYGAETRMNASTDPRSMIFGGDSVAAGAPYIGAGFNPDPSKAAATPDAAAKASAAPSNPPSAVPSAAVSAPSSQVADMGPPNLSHLNQNAAPSPAADPNAATSNVVKNGNSYSGTNIAGDITINGAAPRNGGAISAQNMAAAESLAARGFSPGASVPSAQTAGAARGFAPVTAPVVRNSTNDWQARQDLKNAQTAASSITANGGRWDRNKGISQERATYAAMLQNDLAMQGMQPGVDVAAMREQGANDRAQLQDAGATTRAAMQEAGQNQRAQGRLGVEQGDLELRRTAQGFQTRAAQQQEQLRGVITDPKSTQAQREQAQRTLEALNGKGEHWKGVALQGGMDAQGNKTESVLAAVNERTGEMRKYGGQPNDLQAKALAIRDNKTMTEAQKRQALVALGF